MAEGAPKHTPVENLGRGKERSESDDAPSFARFLELPPELRVMVYEGRFEESETVPSAHTQPGLAFTSRLLRQEALHTFYTRSTFAATMNIWTSLNDQGLETSLDRSTDNMLDNIAQADLSLIRKVKLLLVFNMEPNRRFEVTFDFSQWHDFACAVRIERVMPKAHVEYGDYFMGGIRVAMEATFNQVRPENGKRVTCERVLSVAETEVDAMFYWKEEWYEMAYYETLKRAWSGFGRRLSLERQRSPSGRGVFNVGEERGVCARPSTLTASLLPHMEPPSPALTGPPVCHLLFTVLQLLYDAFAEHHHLAREQKISRSSMEAAQEHLDRNATQSDIMTAGTTDACYDHEPFPFMKLPPELRLMVYQFAFHDITDPIMFPESREVQKPHPCRGALALLCTSKFVRRESRRAMWRNAHRYFLVIDGVWSAAIEWRREVRTTIGFSSPAYDQAQDNSDQAGRQFMSLSAISSALARAMVADYADRKAQSEKDVEVRTAHHEANERSQ